MDNQIESRKQFAQQNGMTMEFVDWFFDNKKDGLGNVWFMMAAAMWEGWKWRGDSLVVELPEQEKYDDPLSAHEAIQDCAKAVRAIGIRIKGEGDKP